jgi:hypothetical protein
MQNVSIGDYRAGTIYFSINACAFVFAVSAAPALATIINVTANHSYRDKYSPRKMRPVSAA